MERMIRWENISTPIQGSSGLVKYKITKTREDWKNNPGNNFMGGSFLNNTNVSIMDKVMSAGCSSIPSYHHDYYTEKCDWYVKLAGNVSIQDYAAARKQRVGCSTRFTKSVCFYPILGLGRPLRLAPLQNITALFSLSLVPFP